MSRAEKDRGLGSVFKRDDQRLQQLREKDSNFILESYSECYTGYQEYNREVVYSNEKADLSRMDMGRRAKGRLHRWDFESEEDWAKYNEQKEATVHRPVSGSDHVFRVKNGMEYPIWRSLIYSTICRYVLFDLDRPVILSNDGACSAFV